MSETKQITLSIDGQYVQIEEGMPIIEAAQKLNVFIPTLCYHEALRPYGACRLCIVEVIHSKRSTLATSCNYPAREGLEVLTQSARVKQVRRMILEVLLARCQDVPVIQELAEQTDVETSRFKKRENHQCILCGLCVRVCEELVGVGALGFVNRGTEREVGTPFGAVSDICIGCGACSFVCPTGCIEMVTNEDDRNRCHMKMGDLSLNTCPNGHQCESCEIDSQFLDEAKRAIAELRGWPEPGMSCTAL